MTSLSSVPGGDLAIALVRAAGTLVIRWPIRRLSGRRYRVLLWLTGFGIAAILMAVAAATVFSAVYINAEAFGGLADYLKLGIVAFGSTTLTGAAGILLTLKRPHDAQEANLLS